MNGLCGTGHACEGVTVTGESRREHVPTFTSGTRKENDDYETGGLIILYGQKNVDYI